MFGMSLGMIVEGSVAVLLAVTIGYCVVLNGRLKRLHADREALKTMVADMMQATNMASSAVAEMKSVALEADKRLDQRIAEAAELEAELAAQVATGSQLVEKISRITQAAKSQQIQKPEFRPDILPAARPADPSEPQSRLHSALQQLAMRPSIGGKAA